MFIKFWHYIFGLKTNGINNQIDRKIHVSFYCLQCDVIGLIDEKIDFLSRRTIKDGYKLACNFALLKTLRRGLILTLYKQL